MEEQFLGYLTDTEKYKIIESLSDEVLISTIKDQIKISNFDLFEKKSHIEIFEKRYMNVMNYYKDNEDLIQELSEVRSKFYREVENTLKHKYGIIINEDLSDRFLIIKALYNHFIINNKNTYVNFFLNFINNNRDTILSVKEINKSVEAFILKKKFKNKEYINILSNLYPITDYIMNLELDNMHILELSLEEGEVNSFIIKNNISKLTIEPDFSDKFMNVVRENRSNYFTLVTTIQQILLDEFNMENNK